MEEKKRITKKKKAVELIEKVLKGESYYNFKEISKITGYHEKYLLKIKNALVNGTLQYEHGNSFRKPHNAISDEERDYIIDLYKRSNASIRQFSRFYKKRSYSCIWHVLHDAGLIKEK